METIHREKKMVNAIEGILYMHKVKSERKRKRQYIKVDDAREVYKERNEERIIE